MVGEPNEFDVELLGYSDDILEYLVKRLEWEFPDLKRDLFDEELLRDHIDAATSSVAESVEYEFTEPSRYHFPGAIERAELDVGSDKETSEVADERSDVQQNLKHQKEDSSETPMAQTLDSSDVH